MDSITLTGMEDEEKGSEDKKKGHGRKIRATKSYKKKKDKRAVAVMISISNEGVFIEDSTLTEKERADKELAKLVPLHTDWWSVEVLSTERCQVVDFIIGRFVPSINAIIYHGDNKEEAYAEDHRTLEGYLTENVFIGSHFKGKLNNLMIQLCKNCNHPDLVESAYDGSFRYPLIELIVSQCSKFRLLERLLSELLAPRHNVLVFSQWTKVLDIMDYYFSEKGFYVFRLDGHVKLDERKRQIKDFDDVNSELRIYLLSTRAGGLDINLTAADTCILYDN
ncbi:hypothetical protein T459_10954 [Capsicum annuum]|uniref:Helicase C-terminal domain-containing protein n=1 Tax=Capsicum annuum TaxID=4072 RepID=A0A2G3A3N8_CAPAN|nr:hypothetical protein FXO37_35999 [Capsicum annuum]PHT88848.1 hypothetical protein T459_10954 [Capsicum annuum]